MVGRSAGKRGEDDGGHRSAKGKMHGVFIRDTLQPKAKYEHGYDDQAAAYAKQACQHACDGSHGRVHDYQGPHGDYRSFIGREDNGRPWQGTWGSLG